MTTKELVAYNRVHDAISDLVSNAHGSEADALKGLSATLKRLDGKAARRGACLAIAEVLSQYERRAQGLR